MQGHANQAGKEHATPASGPTCRVPGQPACCAQCSGGMPGRQGARAATHPGRERLRRGPGPAGRPQCPPGPPRPYPRSATGPPVAHVGRPPSPPSQPPDKEEGTLTRTAPASLHTTTASSGTACAVGEQGRRTRQHCCCSQEPRGGSAPLKRTTTHTSAGSHSPQCGFSRQTCYNGISRAPPLVCLLASSLYRAHTRHHSRLFQRTLARGEERHTAPVDAGFLILG